MAVQAPINYGLGLTPLNPAEAMRQGMVVGQGLLDARETGLQNQQAALERPIALQQAQLKLRTGLAAEADANAQRALAAAAQQSAAMRAAEMQAATQKYLQNPTPEAANEFFTRFPEHPLSKQYDKVIASRTEAQREQDFSRSMQVTSALEAGTPEAQETAARFMDGEAEKFASIDEKQAKAFRQTAEMIRKDPKQTLAYLQGLQSKLAPSLGKSIEELRSVDAKVREAGAKASQTEAQAKIADAQAQTAFEKIAADLGLTKAQTAKYWADIQNDKRKTQLAEMEAADKAAGVEKGKPLEASTVKEIAATQASLDGIDEILTRKKSVDTGPISGKQNTVAQILGIDDQEKSRMRAELGNAVNSMISTLSGANVPPEEFARIREGLPQFDDNDDAFVSKTLATRASVQRLLDRTLKANKAAGRDVSGFEATTEDAWSQLPKAG